MVLGKPSVTYNFTQCPSPIPYAENGATIPVSNQQTLTEALTQILFNPTTVDKLKKRWPQFIQEQTYKLDGKASDRTAELMESMCLE